ncbi:MAG: serine/threonine-protein kinase [Endozoicomonadaceae bacterium]|nr:serine/threonine-protein kinase [Endozoicomonadaceae bacterium]
MTSITPGNGRSNIQNDQNPQQETDIQPKTTKAFAQDRQVHTETGKKLKLLNLWCMLRESKVGKKLHTFYQSLKQISNRRLTPVNTARGISPEYQGKVKQPPDCHNFQLGKKIGSGTSGSVFSASVKSKPSSSKTPNKLEKSYAVKIQKLCSLSPSRHADKIDLEVDLQKSIPFAPVITGHKIIQTNDSQSSLIIMENRGENLIGLIYGNKHDLKTVDNKPISSALARSISRQFIDQLQQLHQQGIVHRDIKLGNLVIDHRGMVKIIDYGSAQQTKSEKLPLYVGEVGTPAYIAPEVFSGQPYTAAVDIWSSAIMLYEILTGCQADMMYDYIECKDQYIFKPEVFSHFIHKIESHETLSASAKDLILKMLDHNPDKRLIAEEVLQHLFFTEADSTEHQESFAELQVGHIQAINELARYEQMEINIKIGKSEPGTPSMAEVKHEIKRLQDEVRRLQDDMSNR